MIKCTKYLRYGGKECWLLFKSQHEDMTTHAWNRMQEVLYGIKR